MTRQVRSFALAMAALTMSLAAQAGAPAAQPAQDKELPEKLGKLKEVVLDKKMARDAEGLDLITVLLKKWEAGLNDKDRAQVVKGLDGVFQQGKLRDPDKLQLYTAAAVALGRLGKEGSKPLVEAIKGDRFPNKKEWIPMREMLLKQLGKTKDESTIEMLLKMAKSDPEPAIEAAAGEALGNFDESKDSIRKEIFNILLIKWGEFEVKATPIDPANIEAQNARNALTVISGKWNETFRRITRQNLDKFSQWQEWYNKNKGKEWK
jgi:hypothetical protein